MNVELEQDQSLRIDIYLLIAQLLRESPSQDLLHFLTEIELNQGTQPMAIAWAKLKSAAQAGDVSKIEEEFQDLFIGVGRGEVVPFGSWHIAGALMEKPLSDLRQSLAELGFERNEDVKEPEDHMAALCEVMSLLIESSNDEPKAAFAIQKKFFNQHISPWYLSLVNHIQQSKSADFYLAVAALIEGYLSLEQVNFAENPMNKRNNSKIDVKNVVDSATN
ncbi:MULTISPECIES: TorD/DmsD family molecular chaperone [Vibrio]|uniref:Molecular chaperone n=1 Tax=Vibrio cortegadensis TaxID=1328770 RepID=A0ABV4M844_9VIBR|nr:molecular chaperone TorD family protein [Vibrio genomosp. F6]